MSSQKKDVITLFRLFRLDKNFVFFYLVCNLQSDFANNEKFITLNIDSSDGKRIYYNGNSIIMICSYLQLLNYKFTTMVIP